MLLLTLLTACPKNEEAVEAAAADQTHVEKPTTEGLTLVEVDFNNDGTVDVRNYYRERAAASRLLVRRETDLNGDGQADVYSYFDDLGQLTKEEMDTDFDKKVDWVDIYQGGERVISEVDLNFDGVFDLKKVYEKGKVRTKERDTNGDGKKDYWEYFDDAGNIVKTGKDIDGDGVMDERGT